MEWMLSVCDHIVELVPSWQRYPDGSTMEVLSPIICSLLVENCVYSITSSSSFALRFEFCKY